MTKLQLGEFEEIVLLMVVVHHDDAYGLLIANSIKEKLGRNVTLSSVHTALYRLEEKGYLVSSIGGATSERGGRSKRIFSITTLGKKALEVSRDSRNLLWDLISPLAFKGL